MVVDSCKKQNCDEVHGLDGFTRMSQIIRPYRELRGFYFGVRSVLYKMCVPLDKDGTAYTQLREIEINRDGDYLTLNFRPLKPQHFSLISYKASLCTEPLDPICNPRDGGELQLGGYFNKELYCSITTVFKNIVKVISGDMEEFQAHQMECSEEYYGILDREDARVPQDVVVKYKFYVKNGEDGNTLSEEISFIVNR